MDVRGDQGSLLRGGDMSRLWKGESELARKPQGGRPRGDRAREPGGDGSWSAMFRSLGFIPRAVGELRVWSREGHGGLEGGGSGSCWRTDGHERGLQAPPRLVPFVIPLCSPSCMASLGHWYYRLPWSGGAKERTSGMIQARDGRNQRGGWAVAGGVELRVWGLGFRTLRSWLLPHLSLGWALVRSRSGRQTCSAGCVQQGAAAVRRWAPTTGSALHHWHLEKGLWREGGSD